MIIIHFCFKIVNKKLLKLNNFIFNEGIIHLKIVILGDMRDGNSTIFKTIKEYLDYRKEENKKENKYKKTEENYFSTLIKYGNYFINNNIFDA